MAKGLQRILNGTPELQNMLAILRNLLKLSLRKDQDKDRAWVFLIFKSKGFRNIDKNRLKSFIVLEKFSRGICLQKENIGFDAGKCHFFHMFSDTL